MKRQILRFPGGQQFRKVLEDDHEWLILTNTRLNPLVMKRSKVKNGIDRDNLENAYRYIKKKYANTEGKTLNIYDIHTHPGSAELVHSRQDMTHFILDKLINIYKINVVGYGVMTKKGIFVVALPDNIARLKELYPTFEKKYAEKTQEYIKTKIDNITPEYAEQLRSGAVKKRKRTTTLFGDAHKNALKQLVKEEPDLQTKTVRRTHIVNMRRLRR